MFLCIGVICTFFLSHSYPGQFVFVFFLLEPIVNKRKLSKSFYKIYCTLYIQGIECKFT